MSLVGCGPASQVESNGTAPAQAETKSDDELLALTVAKIYEASRTSDWRVFRQLHRQEDDEALLKLVYRYANAAYKLRDKVTAEYGDDGWTKLRDPQADSRVMLDIPPDDDAWTSKLKFAIEGDRATTLNPWTKLEERYVREDGVWKRDLFSQAPAEGKDGLAKVLTRFAEAIEHGESTADRNTIPIEELRREVAERMLGRK